jgi:hypothetical protein
MFVNPLEKQVNRCPVCGSDRKTTRIGVTDGRTTGPCPDSWHTLEQSDGRLGGGSRTPSPTRSRDGF